MIDKIVVSPTLARLVVFTLNADVSHPLLLEYCMFYLEMHSLSPDERGFVLEFALQQVYIQTCAQHQAVLNWRPRETTYAYQGEEGEIMGGLCYHFAEIVGYQEHAILALCEAIKIARRFHDLNVDDLQKEVFITDMDLYWLVAMALMTIAKVSVGKQMQVPLNARKARTIMQIWHSHFQESTLNLEVDVAMKSIQQRQARIQILQLTLSILSQHSTMDMPKMLEDISWHRFDKALIQTSKSVSELLDVVLDQTAAGCDVDTHAMFLKPSDTTRATTYWDFLWSQSFVMEKALCNALLRWAVDPAQHLFPLGLVKSAWDEHTAPWDPILEDVGGKSTVDLLSLMKGILKQFADKKVATQEAVDKPINCKHPDAKLGPRLRKMYEIAAESEKVHKHLSCLEKEVFQKLKNEVANKGTGQKRHGDGTASMRVLWTLF
jgi:hypothetical protein